MRVRSLATFCSFGRLGWTNYWPMSTVSLYDTLSQAILVVALVTISLLKIVLGWPNNLLPLAVTCHLALTCSDASLNHQFHIPTPTAQTDQFSAFLRFTRKMYSRCREIPQVSQQILRFFGEEQKTDMAYEFETILTCWWEGVRIPRPSGKFLDFPESAPATSPRISCIMVVTGKSLDSPEKQNHDKMSKHVRKMSRNCPKIARSPCEEKNWHFLGHFWCLFGQCFYLVTLSNARPLLALWILSWWDIFPPWSMSIACGCWLWPYLAQGQDCKRKTASIASLDGQGSSLPSLFLIIFDLHCAQSIIPYRQHRLWAVKVESKKDRLCPSVQDEKESWFQDSTRRCL